MSALKKKLPKLKAATSSKLLKACEINDLRKNYNKLWINVKEDTLPIVEELGGFLLAPRHLKSGLLSVMELTTIPIY
jgi:hypothetical protein